MRPQTVSAAKPELRTESRSMPSSRFAGKRIHFIGIGGCGMAGLARMLLDAGAIVTGSDPSANPQTFDLTRRGAKITRTQMGELLSKDIELVVRTAAVPDSNTEFLAARRLGLPTIKYAQLLGQVMAERFAIAVSGTHGKTTTTSMISHALLACGKDPSFVIGGTVPQLGGSSRSGAGNDFVVEACEYDRSFHNLHPTVAIITNIEADHLDCYGSLENIIRAFHDFAALVPAHGLILANGADPNVKRAIAGLTVPVQTVALAPTPHCEPHPALFDQTCTATWTTVPTALSGGLPRGEVFQARKKVATLKLSVPGIHNLYNATLALAACVAAGADPKDAARAISSFTGVDRRMTRVGLYNGATIIDDYGHHPTEIAVTLRALKERYSPARLFCVFQPHQHSRTRTLLDQFATCFTDATHVLIPAIYSVRDSDEEKRLTSAQTLVDRVNAVSANAIHLPTFDQITQYLKQNARAGDLILTIGAGNVCEIAHELAGQSVSAPVP